MRISSLIILLLYSSVCAAEECTYQIKVNNDSYILNKSSANDIKKAFGEAESLRTIYEIPFYDLCYKTKDGEKAIIFGFDSNTNLLRSSSIIAWNEIIANHIKCSDSQLSRFSINDKFIGMNIKKHSSLEKIFVSKSYCHIKQKGSVISGILVSFGVFLVDLE